MAPDDPADNLRRRMAELRRELTGDVREVGRSARVMTDWTFYVRRFPWAAAGVAAVAGFMLIPRKKEIIAAPDAEVIAELVRKKQIRVEAKTQAKDSPTFVKSLVMMGITWAARAGMNYMGQQIQNAAAQARNKPPQEVPAPSPLEEPWPK